MKKNLSFSVLCLLGMIVCSIGCKSKQPIGNTGSDATGQAVGATSEKPKTTGKVSHLYQSTGCGTVIIVTNPNNATPMILIPIPNTSLKELDVDGLEVSFHYRALKMKNPDGCTAGSPADITDLVKK
jgi:hypothetical protein